MEKIPIVGSKQFHEKVLTSVHCTPIIHTSYVHTPYRTPSSKRTKLNHAIHYNIISAKLHFFWGGEHPPDATETFQLFPRRHLSLHHNGKDSLATETGAVEQTPVIWS